MECHIRRTGRILAAAATLLLSAAGMAAQATTSAAKLTLAELEQMALEKHPALAQAAARVRAADGRRLQAGLYPNPMVGYNADEVSTGPIIRGGEHGFFVEQSIVTGGKLRLSREVASQEHTRATAEADAQRLRVLTTLRMYYYEALGAERLVQLHEELAKLTSEAVDVSRQLANVGQADQPDLLEAEVEAQRAELALIAARNHRERAWQQLAAAAGNPSLPMSMLAGSLDQQLPALDFEGSLAELLRNSPEMKVAQAGAAREQSAVKRARVDWIPDVNLRGGVRYNRELLESGGRPVGTEGFVDIGVRIPIFDRNQGNVAAARAELEMAERQVERVALALRSRLADAFRAYRDAAAAVERYRDHMLPRSQRAFELYQSKYQQMAAAYPQVLIARRSHFQLQVEHVRSLVELWRSRARIEGLLLEDTMRE